MKDFKACLGQMCTPGSAAATISGAILGILFAILFLTIGFWKTLLIVLCCLIGALIGAVKDKKALLCRLSFRKDKSES